MKKRERVEHMLGKWDGLDDKPYSIAVLNESLKNNRTWEFMHLIRRAYYAQLYPEIKNIIPIQESEELPLGKIMSILKTMNLKLEVSPVKEDMSKDDEYAGHYCPLKPLPAIKIGHFLHKKKTLAISLLDCLIDNDPKGFMKVIEESLDMSKSRLSDISGIAKAAVYHAFSKSTHRVPNLKTVAAIVSAIFKRF